jgi:hypothetical protein
MAFSLLLISGETFSGNGGSSDERGTYSRRRLPSRRRHPGRGKIARGVEQSPDVGRHRRELCRGEHLGGAKEVWQGPRRRPRPGLGDPKARSRLGFGVSPSFSAASGA